MPARWCLQLECFQLSVAVAAEIVKGDWLSVIRLDLARTKLTKAVVHELLAANWPALSYLSIVMPVDMGILSLLSQAHWPQLIFLDLLKVRKEQD